MRLTSMSLSLAVCAATVFGCDGGDDDRVGSFVGEWSYTGQEFRCADTGPSVFLGDSKGLLLHVTRVDSSHIKMATTPECELDFVLARNAYDYTATALPGQQCQIDVPTLGARSLSIATWQLGADAPWNTVASSYSSGNTPAPVAAGMSSDANGAVDGCSALSVAGELARP